MHELATVCALFGVLPVTVAITERSFSKLQRIKSYLRSAITQDRLDALALLSIGNKDTTELTINKIVNSFADSRARDKLFKIVL